jgi:hypothetical protein
MSENPSWAMMFNPHPLHNGTVMNELTAALSQPRYQQDKERYIRYLNERLSEEYGLKGDKCIHGGFHIRDMDHPMTFVIGSKWYSEILESGCEDQISLAFIYERYSEFIGLTDETMGLFVG